MLLGLVCGGCTVLSTSCSSRGRAASLDALQEHIARQITDQLHQARTNCVLRSTVTQRTQPRRRRLESHHQSLALLPGIKSLWC